MDLNKGAVSKRWSRMKKSMEQGEAPTGSAYKFLWLCLKHSNRDKVSAYCRCANASDFCLHVLTVKQGMNWAEIAEQCGTTAGAASKRYSRMKQAFEAGDAAPDSGNCSPAPKTPSKTTPRKKTAAANGEGTPTPNRKRASPKKKAVNEAAGEEDDDEDIKVKPEPDGDAAEESEEETKKTPKKARVTKAKAAPKTKADGKAGGRCPLNLRLSLEHLHEVWACGVELWRLV